MKKPSSPDGTGETRQQVIPKVVLPTLRKSGALDRVRADHARKRDMPEVDLEEILEDEQELMNHLEDAFRFLCPICRSPNCWLVASYMDRNGYSRDEEGFKKLARDAKAGLFT